MKIAILVAMEKELAQLRSLLEDVREQHFDGRSCHIGDIGGHECALMQCGIGKVNAAMSAVEFILQYHPDIMISSGVAGGCGDGVRVLDAVVSTACCYHDVYCGSECEYGQVLGMPARFSSPVALVERLCHESAGARVHAGLIATGDWFVDSREKMRAILNAVPDAMAVDMESAAIAQVCHQRGLPFVSIRVISDTPLSDDKATQYFDFWNRVATGSFQITRRLISSL